MEDFVIEYYKPPHPYFYSFQRRVTCNKNIGVGVKVEF
jgi:hypothetical protein